MDHGYVSALDLRILQTRNLLINLTNLLLQVQHKHSFKLRHAIVVLFRARQILNPHSEVGYCRVAQVERLSLFPDAELL